MNAKRIAKRIISLGPCMCGATDCPSCGPAQGYSRCEDCGEWDCECDEICLECGEADCDSDECRAMQMDPPDTREGSLAPDDEMGLAAWEADLAAAEEAGNTSLAEELRQSIARRREKLSNVAREGSLDTYCKRCGNATDEDIAHPEGAPYCGSCYIQMGCDQHRQQREEAVQRGRANPGPTHERIKRKLLSPESTIARRIMAHTDIHMELPDGTASCGATDTRSRTTS